MAGVGGLSNWADAGAVAIRAALYSLPTPSCPDGISRPRSATPLSAGRRGDRLFSGGKKQPHGVTIAATRSCALCADLDHIYGAVERTNVTDAGEYAVDAVSYAGEH